MLKIGWMDCRRWIRARALTLGALAVFAGLTVAMLATQGLVLSHDWLFGWVVLGLLALSLSDLRRWARGVVIDWLPFAGFLIAYDIARGVADNVGIAPHISTGLDFDRFLFGSPLPTNWLQTHLFDATRARWYDYGTFFVYLSHFFVTLVIAAALWRWAYPQFKRFRAMVLALAGVGFLTYILFPAAPPWMAATDGRLPYISRTIGYMWVHVGFLPARSLFENGSGYVNDVAAVPSLHAAYTFLVLLFFWRRARWWLRALLVAYPLAMAFTLVYGGEHYVFDVVLGWAYAVGVFAAVNAFERVMAKRRARVEEPVARLPLPEPSVAAYEHRVL
ncbi:MAG TPA: phosphatase PAP2 family protein [Thermoleophilaceae bacterium]|nr:phosphatase PAP2 family protein [Thermoleophilaceae bacterium]